MELWSWETIFFYVGTSQIHFYLNCIIQCIFLLQNKSFTPVSSFPSWSPLIQVESSPLSFLCFYTLNKRLRQQQQQPTAFLTFSWSTAAFLMFSRSAMFFNKRYRLGRPPSCRAEALTTRALTTRPRRPPDNFFLISKLVQTIKVFDMTKHFLTRRTKLPTAIKTRVNDWHWE